MHVRRKSKCGSQSLVSEIEEWEILSPSRASRNLVSMLHRFSWLPHHSRFSLISTGFWSCGNCREDHHPCNLSSHEMRARSLRSHKKLVWMNTSKIILLSFLSQNRRRRFAIHSAERHPFTCPSRGSSSPCRQKPRTARQPRSRAWWWERRRAVDKEEEDEGRISEMREINRVEAQRELDCL